MPRPGTLALVAGACSRPMIYPELRQAVKGRCFGCSSARPQRAHQPRGHHHPASTRGRARIGGTLVPTIDLPNRSQPPNFEETVT